MPTTVAAESTRDQPRGALRDRSSPSDPANSKGGPCRQCGQRGNRVTQVYPALVPLRSLRDQSNGDRPLPAKISFGSTGRKIIEIDSSGTPVRTRALPTSAAILRFRGSSSPPPVTSTRAKRGIDPSLPAGQNGNSPSARARSCSAMWRKMILIKFLGIPTRMKA